MWQLQKEFQFHNLLIGLRHTSIYSIKIGHRKFRCSVGHFIIHLHGELITHCFQFQVDRVYLCIWSTTCSQASVPWSERKWHVTNLWLVWFKGNGFVKSSKRKVMYCIKTQYMCAYMSYPYMYVESMNSGVVSSGAFDAQYTACDSIIQMKKQFKTNVNNTKRWKIHKLVLFKLYLLNQEHGSDRWNS